MLHTIQHPYEAVLCEIATQRLPAVLLKAEEVRLLNEDLAWMMTDGWLGPTFYEQRRIRVSRELLRAHLTRLT